MKITVPDSSDIGSSTLRTVSFEVRLRKNDV